MVSFENRKWKILGAVLITIGALLLFSCTALLPIDENMPILNAMEALNADNAKATISYGEDKETAELSAKELADLLKEITWMPTKIKTTTSSKPVQIISWGDKIKLSLYQGDMPMALLQVKEHRQYFTITKDDEKKINQFFLQYFRPEYTLIHMKQKGKEKLVLSSLSKEEAAVVEQVLMAALLQSGRHKGVEIQGLEDYWVIRETYKNKDIIESYLYEKEGKAYLQGLKDYTSAAIPQNIFWGFIQKVDKVAVVGEEKGK